MSAVRRWWRRARPEDVVTVRSPLLAVSGLRPRRVTLYLPPRGPADPAEPSGLLVALDGQSMPRWRLAETLAELVLAGAIPPVVIAAVPASADRMEEYGTAGQLDFAGRGRLAQATQELIANEVLPWVRVRHVVTADPARTGIFGASLGGLCAFDTAWQRPDLFGIAGVFSGSLWWRTDNANVAAQQATRIAHQRVRQSPTKPNLRLWFQAGTEDETADRDGNGVIDAIQDATELVGELAVKGFTPGRDVVYHEIPGGRHHERTWAQALPEFLRWAFPPSRQNLPRHP